MRSGTGDRGAAVVEYAMLVALILVVSIGAIQSLEGKGKAKVDDGADDRGRPTEQLFLPSASGSIIGGGSGSSVGSGDATVEVFEVVGASATDTSTNPNTWVATVTVKVKNVATPELWSGVTVTGTWFYLKGPTPTTAVGTCPTDSSGLCTITLSGLKPSPGSGTASVEFRDIVLSGTGITHQPPSPDPVSTSGPIFKP